MDQFRGLRQIRSLPSFLGTTTTRLYGVKMFTVLDVRKGFWHFLQRCPVRGIKLNHSKIPLRQKTVPFIGHEATD